MHNMFKGIITALVTPFIGDILDLDSLEKLIKHQINGKIKTIVIAGSTGEACSLKFEEYEELINFVIPRFNNVIVDR